MPRRGGASRSDAGPHRTRGRGSDDLAVAGADDVSHSVDLERIELELLRGLLGRGRHLVLLDHQRAASLLLVLAGTNALRKRPPWLSTGCEVPVDLEPAPTHIFLRRLLL